MSLDSKLISIMQNGAVYAVRRTQKGSLWGPIYIKREEGVLFKYNREYFGTDNFNLSLIRYDTAARRFDDTGVTVLHDKNLGYINEYLEALSDNKTILIEYDNYEVVRIA